MKTQQADDLLNYLEHKGRREHGAVTAFLDHTYYQPFHTYRLRFPTGVFLSSELDEKRLEIVKSVAKHLEKAGLTCMSRSNSAEGSIDIVVVAPEDYDDSLDDGGQS